MEKIIERVKNILMNPKVTWETIKLEKTDVKQLFTGYLLILAAIGPICRLIGSSIVGRGWQSGFGYRVPFGTGLGGAIFSYIFFVASIYILAIVVNALAPQFSSKKNMDQALKLCVYFPTAAMVAGVFYIIPGLSILGFLGSLYSLYLLYIGLPVMMDTPQQKVLGYFITIIVVSVILMMLIGAITGALFATTLWSLK
jgi:hypothetical protein